MYMMIMLRKKSISGEKRLCFIEAENFARANNSDRIHWEVIPDFGKQNPV
jgi:hypothetical protein